MTVTKCDRCGAVYEGEQKINIGDRTARGTLIIPLNPIISILKSEELTMNYDLCEDCFGYLIDFLGNNGGYNATP